MIGLGVAAIRRLGQTLRQLVLGIGGGVALLLPDWGS